MKLSTTLSAYIGSYSKTMPSLDCYLAAIKDCARMGFEVLDFPFIGGSSTFLNDGEDYKTPVLECKKYAESLGCRFRYAHVPFGYPAADDTEGWALFDRKMRRSLEGCALLGIEWTAIHPYDMAAPLYDAKAAHERSINHLTPYAKLAKEYGFGIAVENTVDRVLVPYRRYCSTVENLCLVIDDLRSIVGDKTVGACLDTGHANASGLDHYAAVHVLGERLKMLHVNDNNGLADDHIPLFCGTVNWLNLVKALKEVGYPGDFNFEIKFGGVPTAAPLAKDALVKYCMEASKYLISTVE